MNYQKTKIYYDSSHYIGIPQGSYPSGKGCKRRGVKQPQQSTQTNPNAPKTPLEAFEQAYKESLSLPKRERKAHIKKALSSDFDSAEEATAFVNKNTSSERKQTP